MKIKKRSLAVVVILVVLTLILLTACNSAEEEITITGSGEGYLGEIVLEVTMLGDQVINIEAIEWKDTQGLFDTAFDIISDAVIDKQSTEDIDVIAGATGSSNGILEAIEDALSKND